MLQLCILGNLGNEPTVRTAANGREFMTFSVASSDRDKHTTWVNVIAIKMEGILPYMQKGRQVLVMGSVDIKVYKSEPDITLHADVVQLAGGKMDAQAPATAPTPQSNDTF